MADEGSEFDRRIIDTNVLATANGHHDGAPADCVAACAVKLQEIMETGHVVLDDDWRILNQYADNVYGSGAGETFLQWLFQHNADPMRCTQVPITPRPDDLTDFDEVPAPLDLPEGEHIDPSDRMFLAVAAAHPDRPAIVQATDSKWIGWEAALEQHGIEIEWVCRDYAESTYGDKMPHRTPVPKRAKRKSQVRRRVHK
jgi:hypothetical protein